MVDDANVTSGVPTSETLDESVAAVTADRPAEPPAEPGTSAAVRPQRTWSMPKSPVTREQADAAGRAALRAARRLVGFVLGFARALARAVTGAGRLIAAVPPAVQLFAGAGVLMLSGIVGAIALGNTLGLLCTVVVIPVCAGVLGALAHRWYHGLAAEATPRADPQRPELATSDLQRSVHYVDRKLAVALTSLGTERHQQAVIALFQAKTAVELTLGTENDTASCSDLSLRADDYALRPRIRAGTEPTPALRESDSLAAS
ncbi:hypothetical protein EV589_1610 [Mycobacterium sp. BK558]|nr:hypothetical protein EV589_1610 [Mycobacterium sp. BK558]